MLRTLFVLCAFLVGGVAALRSRFNALLFYIWFALFRPQEWAWIDITKYRPSLIVGALLVVPSLATGIWPNVTHPLSVSTLAFLMTALIAHRGAVDPVISWYWLGLLAKLVLVSLFLVTLTNSNRRLVSVLLVISASLGFFTAKAGVASILAGGARFSSGLGGSFDDNNAYAVGATMALYLMIASAQNASSRWIRLGFWLAVPLTAVTVVSTFSRSGFLALGVSGMAFLMLRRRRWLFLAASVLLVPLLLWAAPLPTGYIERMKTIRSYEQVQEDSALSRLHFWRVALSVSADHPLGIGLWNFESVYDKYDDLDGRYGRRRAVHNSFLQALTEAGWSGGALFLGMFGYALVASLRVSRRAATRGLPPEEARFFRSVGDALLASTVAFIVGGSFVSMAYNDLTWLTFGVIASAERISKNAVNAATAHLFVRQGA